MTKIGKIHIFLPIFVYTLVFVLIGVTANFSSFGVPVMKPTFADLRLITSASECFQNTGWSMISASCDPWGRPFNYPSIWVKIFGGLGITQASTQFIGIIEIFILSLTFLYWVWRFKFLINGRENSVFFSIFVGSFFLSPPVLLLMERGNVDILIFAGLTIAAELLRRQSILSGGLLIAFLTILKLYPVGGIFAALVSTASKSKQVFILIASLSTFFLIFGEASFISSRSLTTWNSISYGLDIIPFIVFEKFGLADSRFMAIMWGLGGLFTLTLICKIILNKQIERVATEISQKLDKEKFFNLFGATFFITYLMGTSYDYRLVFTLPIFLIFFMTCHSRFEKLIIFLLMFSVMYGGHLTLRLTSVGMILNTLSDALIGLTASLVILILVQIRRKTILR